MRGRAAAIALTLAFAGCAGPAPPPALPGAPATPATPAATGNVDLDNAADGARVTLARGAELKVVLDANATTGFQWQVAGDVPPQLAPIGTRIYVSRGDPRSTGGGGINVFRFRGEQAGQAVLQFEYRRPWETGIPAAKTVRYQVTVQ